MKRIFPFLINLFFCSFLFSQNICNGGFEDGNSLEWTQNTNSGAVIFSDETTVSEIYSGVNSLKAEVLLADNFRNRIESCDTALIANHTYVISFWAKVVEGSELGIRVKPTAYPFFENVILTSDDYEQVSVTFTPTSDMTTKIRLSFQTVGIYLIDDVTITDISYIDCAGVLDGAAYLDNCGQCVEGTTGVTSSCSLTTLSGDVKTYSDNFFGLNAKNSSDGNFNEDDNIFEGAWKRTKAKIYRYPGGTFGNNFNWRTGNILVGSRPRLLDTPVTPSDLATKLPEDTDILWMVNVRVPLLPVNIGGVTKTWNEMTRAELLSNECLQAKITDVLDGLASFKESGRDVKYLELGNEFYFSVNEGLGEEDGAVGDGGNGKGDHFPYDKNPTVYLQQMGEIAEAVKSVYPDIKIAAIRWKMEAGGQADWNIPINDAFENFPKANQHIDAVTYHWYQTEKYYEGQTEDSPPITDVASSKTAMGYAFDYIDFKKTNDLLNIPDGKEAWITEGDIKDPSTNDTWLDAVRDAVIYVNYGVFDHVTMYTPQIFQPLFIDFENLDLTVKGYGSDMIFAAAEGMLTGQSVNLGGGIFFGDNGGPYPDLQGIKFSNGNQDRFVLVNCSNKPYTIDLSNLTTSTNLSLLQRHNSTPWANDSFISEKSLSPDLTMVELEPYSITILSEEVVVEDLIDVNLRVTNPDAEYPDRYVKVFDFGENEINSTYTKSLSIKNTGDVTIELSSSTPVRSVSGNVFSVTQPSQLTIPPSGSVSFDVLFSPLAEGSFSDSIKVAFGTDKEIYLRVLGTGISDMVVASEDLVLNSGVSIYSVGNQISIENHDKPKTVDIEVLSLNGASLIEFNKRKLLNNLNLDLSKLTSGVYFVRVVSEDARTVQRVVVF